jgi:hypothetical protein
LLKNPTIDGKEVGKSSINIIGAKSEPKEGESAQNQERFAAVQNKNKIDMLNRFTKVARKKLQKFSAEKLKEKGLGGFLNKEFKLRRMMLKQVVQQRQRREEDSRNNCQVGGLHQIIKIIGHGIIHTLPLPM